LYPEIPGFSLAHAYLQNRGAELDYDQHPNGDPRLAERYMRLAGYPAGRYRGASRLQIVGSVSEPSAGNAKRVDKTLKALGFATRLLLVTSSAMSVKCGVPTNRVDVCSGVTRIASLGDGEFVLGAPLLGDASRPVHLTRPAQLHKPGLTAAIERESKLVGIGPRAHGWSAVDNGLVGEATAIPYAWLSESAIESKDVAGVGALSNRGAWDYSFTSLK
jgi:peptide/nickel transport system substrate-binding protein